MGVKEVKNRCVIIAGSPDADIDFIRDEVKPSDFIICADRGLLYARAAEITPDLIVGDFDSCGEKIFEKCEIISLDSHKDDTDTMHGIDIALERGYRNFAILCALGGRTDHTFANLCALQYINKKGGRGALLSQNERVELLSRGEYTYEGYKGRTFSLFPFGCESVCVSYEGAEYPLENGILRSHIPMGVSNVFTDEKSVIKINDTNAILIINLKEI